MKIGYAIYSDTVQAKDKYKVTKLPAIQFSTRKKAEQYIKNKNLKYVKILKVTGLPVKMI